MTKRKAIIIGVSVVVFGLGVSFLTKPNKNGKSILGNGGYIDEGDNSTIPVFSAKQKANALYEAMRYSGTDEQTIFEELSGVTQKQFGLISGAFGLRSYNSWLGNTTGVIGQTLPKLSLKMWLKEELSDEDYKLLRKKFPMYL